MSSKSAASGDYTLTVTFEVGTDVDMATVLVQNRVNEALPVLPEEVKRQGVKVEKQSTNITLMVNLVSPEGSYDELFISNYVTTRIKDVLARVGGVSKVEVMGAKDFGMRIWINPDRLRARDLTTVDLIQALREQKKVHAGAQFFQTNLIYDTDQFDLWLEELYKRDILDKVYILAGVTPIRSLRMARYLNDVIPGVTVPSSILHRYEESREDDYEEVGVEITLEIIESIKEKQGIHGIHLMAVGWESIVPRIISEAGLIQ